MGRGLKFAIFVQIVLLVGAVMFLLAYPYVGLGRALTMESLLLSLTIVAVIGGLSALLWKHTLLREALVRRFYISPDWIHNHEIGYAPLRQIVPDGDAYDFVTFAAEALARMSYGFEVATPPEVFEPQLVIDSYVFHFHTTGQDDPDAPGEEDGVVVDEWQGVLRRVDDLDKGDKGLSELCRFNNAGELARLLDDYTALTLGSDAGDEC